MHYFMEYIGMISNLFRNGYQNSARALLLHREYNVLIQHRKNATFSKFN